MKSVSFNFRLSYQSSHTLLTPCLSIDSWKGYSAIGSIILSPFTRLRKIILEILLLEGMGTESDNVLELFTVYDNSEVMDFLLDWESGGREQGQSHFFIPFHYSLAVAQYQTEQHMMLCVS